MAKLKGQDLVANHCRALGWPNTGDYATRALRSLNEAQQAIDQLGSLMHLHVDSSVTLNAGSDFIDVSALNPAIDPGKQVTLKMPGSRRGACVFLDRDMALVAPVDRYGAWGVDTPSYWKWGTSTAGALRIVFTEVNGTGGVLTYPISYQRVSPALVNDNVSESTLIEGYEITLLQPYAEMIDKRRLGKIGWQEIHQMLFGGDEKAIGGRLGRFLDQFSARKEEPKPDREQVERANARKLTEGT